MIDRSDSAYETPFLGIRWCPECEPGRDPCREILFTEWCGKHWPHGEMRIVSLNEVEGVENKKICDLLHRGKES